MAKNRKLLFAVSIVIVTALLLTVFTACVTKEKPGETTPQDTALSEQEVKDMLYSVSIDDDSNPYIIMSMGGGYGADTAYSRTDSEEILYTKTTGTQITEENYYKYDSSGYTRTTDRYYNGERDFYYVDLTEPEFRNYVDENLKSFGQFVNNYVSLILDSSDEFKTYYPDSAYVNLYGTKKVSGEYELNFATVAALDGEAEHITLTVHTDSEKRVTSMQITTSKPEGFFSDVFTNNIITVLDLSVTYDNVKQVPFCEECRNEKNNVTVSPAFDARFPEGFTSSCAPGGELTLPNEVESEIFGAYEFQGWYYDSDYKYPVKDNVMKVTYSQSWQTVYPKFALGKPVLELNGGTFVDNEDVENNVFLYDYMYVMPEKDGYAFEGWYLDSALTQKLDYVNGDVAASSDVTLYAKYDKEVTLKFVTNADYGIYPKKGSEGSTLNAPTIYQKGKRFVGWYTDSALTKPFDGKFPKDDATLYAKYEDGVTINLVYYDGVYNDAGTPKYYVAEKNGDLAELKAVLNGFASNAFYNDMSQEFMCWAVDTAGTEFDSYPTAETTLYAYYVDPAYLVYTIPDGYGITYMDMSIQQLRREYGTSLTFGEWIEQNGLADNLFNNCGVDIGLNKMDYWYEDKACTVKADLTKWPMGSITLYGKILPRLRIDFVIDGEVFDSFVFDSEYPVSDSVYDFLNNIGMLPGGNAMYQLPNGVLIEGWYTDEAMTQIYEIPQEKGDFPAESLTLYAKLTSNYLCTVRSNIDFFADDVIFEYDGDLFAALGANGEGNVYNYEILSAGNGFDDFISRAESEIMQSAVCFIGERQYECTGFYLDPEATERYVPTEYMTQDLVLYLGWSLVQ